MQGCVRTAVKRCDGPYGHLLRAGADWIKLMATGGVFAADDETYSAQLQEQEIAVAVAEAARCGKQVMVHALGGPAIGAAVRAGARSVEHALFLTEEDADLMARRGCALVPTLAIYHELAAMATAGALPSAAAQRMETVTARLGEAVAIARAAGVPIALGTDFGHRDQHGRNLIEVLHLRRAGLDGTRGAAYRPQQSVPISAVSAIAGAVSHPATSSTLSCWTGTPTTSNASPAPRLLPASFGGANPCFPTRGCSRRPGAVTGPVYPSTPGRGRRPRIP